MVNCESQQSVVIQGCAQTRLLACHLYTRNPSAFIVQNRLLTTQAEINEDVLGREL
jgi:hypothetical protein